MFPQITLIHEKIASLLFISEAFTDFRNMQRGNIFLIQNKAPKHRTG